MSESERPQHETREDDPIARGVAHTAARLLPIVLLLPLTFFWRETGGIGRMTLYLFLFAFLISWIGMFTTSRISSRVFARGSFMVTSVVALVAVYVCAVAAYAMSDERRIDAAVARANTLRYDDQNGDAVQAYREALALIDSTDGFEDLKPGLLVRLGFTYDEMNLPRQALATLADARQAADDTSSEHDSYSAQIASASILRRLGLNDESRIAYLDARRYAGTTDDVADDAAVLRELGEVEHLLGNFQIARDNLTESRDIYRSFGGTHWRGTEAFVLLSLGRLERDVGNTELARQHFLDAREMFIASGDHGRLSDLARVELQELRNPGYSPLRQSFGTLRGSETSPVDATGQ